MGLTGLGLKLADLVTSRWQAAAEVVYAGSPSATDSRTVTAFVHTTPSLWARADTGWRAGVCCEPVIFYYDRLSEVSRDGTVTVRRRGDTGGNPMRTTWEGKYTMPAFVVPFESRSRRRAVALRAPWSMSASHVATASDSLLAIAFGGWLRGPVSLVPRTLAGIGGTTLIYPTRVANVAGILLLATAVVWQLAIHTQSRGTTGTAGLRSRDGG